MTITRTELGYLNSTANATTYTTGEATVGSGALDGNANQLIVAMISTTDTVTPSVITSVDNSPWGISSWTIGPTVLHNDDLTRLTVVYGTTGGSDPGSDTFDITVSSGTGNQTGCNIYVWGFTDSGGSAPTLVQAVTDSVTVSGDPTLDTLATLGSSSWVAAAFVLNRNPPALAPDTGWTERRDAGYSTPPSGMVTVDSNGITSDNTPSGLWVDGIWLGAAVEVAEPGGANATATPATVAAVGAVPAPTVQGNATPTPAVVAATAAVPAPTTQGAAQPTPATVAAVGAVPAPTVTGTAAPTPATAAATATVPTPAVLTGGDATALPPTVAATAAVGSPTVSGTATPTPAMVIAQAAVEVFTVRGAAIPTPATVARSVVVPTPSVLTDLALPPPTRLTGLVSSVNTNTYAVPTATYTAGRLYVVFVQLTATIVDDTPGLAGGTGTWTQIDAGEASLGTNVGITAFRKIATATETAALTIGTLATTHTGCIAWVLEIESDFDDNTPVRQYKGAASQVAGTSYSVTLDLAPTGSGMVIAAIGRSVNETSTPDAGWTELAGSDLGHNAPTRSGAVIYDATAPGQTPGLSWTTSTTQRRALAVEILAGAGNATPTPATVAAVAVVPTPTLRSNQITTPATVAASAAVGAPTVVPDTRPAPTTVAAPAALGAPTVAASAVVAPATVAATSAVGVPTFRSDQTASPATVVATAAIGAPTLASHQATSPATVAATAAVGAPTVRGDAVTAPSTVPGVATVPTPSNEGSLVVAPATVAATSAVGAPTVSGTAIPTPATVAATATVPAPVVIVGSEAIATPATVAAAGAVPAPTVTGTATVAPATTGTTGAIPVPTIVSGDSTPTPATVAATATIPVPAIFVGEDITASPATVGAIAAVGAATVRGTAIASPATVAAPAAVPAPTIPGTAADLFDALVVGPPEAVWEAESPQDVWGATLREGTR